MEGGCEVSCGTLTCDWAGGLLAEWRPHRSATEKIDGRRPASKR